MFFDSIPYLSEILTMSFIAVLMAISPGSDFVMVTRNSIFYGKKAGLYSTLGISAAIWVHVAYSIAGLAIIIANSIVLFSILKYLGAAYLIYVGWKTFTSKSIIPDEKGKKIQTISNYESFKIGFISNVLNPKTTIFFLSVFTQLVTVETPIWIQLVYGSIICIAHLVWFTLVAYMFTHPVLLNKFYKHQKVIEKTIGTVLIAFGFKVASASNS